MIFLSTVMDEEETKLTTQWNTMMIMAGSLAIVRNS